MALNEGNEQRFVLIAADFRKEVTATVLWLLGHGVRAQCLQAVPYSFGEDVFIDLCQIIPPPEAGDFMIGMAAKDSEKRAESGKKKHTQAQRHAFWTKALEALRPRRARLQDYASTRHSPRRQDDGRNHDEDRRGAERVGGDESGLDSEAEDYRGSR